MKRKGKKRRKEEEEEEEENSREVCPRPSVKDKKEEEKKIMYVGESKRSDCGILSVCIIMKMPLKIELWKLKTA